MGKYRVEVKDEKYIHANCSGYGMSSLIFTPAGRSFHPEKSLKIGGIGNNGHF
jgi:imidazoleglycerol phosphate synthase glutamine amidotransferase subunit HisH